jgi:1,4-alpha-glucan branching enzyme
MAKPINFFCVAPEARQVFVIGEFNGWQAGVHPMHRQPDGTWVAQIPLHHGHHQYQFLVDGRPTLDPRAQGIARNAANERVSLIAVS